MKTLYKILIKQLFFIILMFAIGGKPQAAILFGEKEIMYE